MLDFLFDDRRRWRKLAASLGLFGLLGTFALIAVPIVRPSVFSYETRADDLDGRVFSSFYQRVRETRVGYFHAVSRRGPNLRFTDAEHLDRIRPAPQPVAGEVTLLGLTLRPGDTVSVRGTFRKPDLVVLTEVRPHPLRWLKYATGVPAFGVVAWLVWRRVRWRGTGLVLRPAAGAR